MKRYTVTVWYDGDDNPFEEVTVWADDEEEALALGEAQLPSGGIDSSVAED